MDSMIKKKKQRYKILFDGNYVGDSWAVSPEKAINNMRFRLVASGDVRGWFDVPMEDFDAVVV